MSDPAQKLILASGSPRRRELLAALGLEFEIIKPDVDETQLPGEAPFTYVQRLSRIKAIAVAERLQDDATVLAADTTVILAADTIGVEDDGEVLGKPIDSADAFATLQRLRGRKHLVCTSFTLKNADHEMTQMIKTTVLMREYTDQEIEAYIVSGDPFDKAGSYAIQNEAFHPVAELDGSYSNVMGLPVCEVREALLKIGYALPVTQLSQRCEEESGEV